MRIYYTLVAILILSGCSNSEFSGGKSSKTSAVADSGDATPAEEPTDLPAAEGSLSEDDKPGLPDRQLLNLVFTNTRIAEPSKVGEARVDFTMKFMRPSDSDMKVSFIQYTVDFSNVKAVAAKRTPNSEYPELEDQKVSIFFDYKFVPEVTKYTDQLFDLGFTKGDGSVYKEPVNYSIKVLTPKAAGSAPATATFSGKAGHPLATPK